VPALRAGSRRGELARVARARRCPRPRTTSGAQRRLRAPWRRPARVPPAAAAIVTSSRSASSDQGRWLCRSARGDDASPDNLARGRGTQRASRTGPRRGRQRLKADRTRARALPVEIARGAIHAHQPRQVVTAASDLSTNSESRLAARTAGCGGIGRAFALGQARRRRSLRGTSPHGRPRTTPTRRKPSHERIRHQPADDQREPHARA